MTPTDERKLRTTLADTYTPGGVEVWMRSRLRQFGLTVNEMFAAGRGDEVLQLAESLRGQVAT